MKVLYTQVYAGHETMPAIVRLPDQTPAPAIVFHNGYAAYKEMYDYMAERLCKAGYVTLQYDPRGSHGPDRGNFLCGTQWREDVFASISYVYGMEEVDRNRIGLAGVSMGGGITIIQGSVDPRLKCLFSMAPPSKYADQMHDRFAENQGEAGWKKHLQGLFDNAARMAHGFPGEKMDGGYLCWGVETSEEEKAEARRQKPHVAHEITLESSLNSYLYFDPLEASRKITIPLCLVHGTADATIPWQCSQMIYDATSAPVKELHFLEGKPHVLPEDAAEEVTELAVSWFGRYL